MEFGSIYEGNFLQKWRITSCSLAVSLLIQGIQKAVLLPHFFPKSRTILRIEQVQNLLHCFLPMVFKSPLFSSLIHPPKWEWPHRAQSQKWLGPAQVPCTSWRASQKYRKTLLHHAGDVRPAHWCADGRWWAGRGREGGDLCWILTLFREHLGAVHRCSSLLGLAPPPEVAQFQIDL